METSTEVPPSVETLKSEVLKALINRPSTYRIEVLNNNSLPEKMKKMKDVSFIVKPPVIDTLCRIAEIANSLPQDIFTDPEKKQDFLKHLDKMALAFAIFVHGNSKKPMPEWYEEFFMDNLTPDELTLLLHECMSKCKTDFFLPCFQIVKLMNPMMMNPIPKMKKNDSTPSN